MFGGFSLFGIVFSSSLALRPGSRKRALACGPGSSTSTIALIKVARTLATLQRVVFLSFSRAMVRQIRGRISQHLPPGRRDQLEVGSESARPSGVTAAAADPR